MLEIIHKHITKQINEKDDVHILARVCSAYAKLNYKPDNFKVF